MEVGAHSGGPGLSALYPRPSPASAAGHHERGGGAGGAGGGARRLPGPARAAPVGAVPGSRPAEAGDEPRGAGQCLGALRERLGEAPLVPHAGPGCCRPRRPLAARPSAPPLQVYAYASSVFREAGIPKGKVQYAVLGTGSCELLAACLSVSLSWARADPPPALRGRGGVGADTRRT